MELAREYENPFDYTAEQYDAEFTYTQIGKMQRAQVWDYLQKNSYLKSPRKILELNCGTGEDALWLSGKGHKVLAMDASAGMIEQAVKKSGERNNDERASAHKIIFKTATFGEVGELTSAGEFDVVFSNFGGLNCISKEEITRLGNDLAKNISEGGRLILVVMSRNCLWEKMYFSLKGKKTAVNRRQSKSGIAVRLKEGTQLTFYYSPLELANAFRANFEFVGKRPIGFFVPPSYLEPFFRNKKYLLRVLSLLDRVAGLFPWLSDTADHYLLELKKR